MFVKYGSNYVREHSRRVSLERLTNTKTIRITNKEPTETTTINEKKAPNFIYFDTKSDDEITHQKKKKNLPARTSSDYDISDLGKSIKRLNALHEIPAK